MGRLLAIAIWIITGASLWMFLSHRWWFPEAIPSFISFATYTTTG